MESRPPQDPSSPDSPRPDGTRPPTGGTPRKPNGAAGSPTHPGLWLILIGLILLIFWLISRNNEVTVNYSPWFLDQVDNDNIELLVIQGLDAKGKLREPRKYQATKDAKI